MKPDLPRVSRSAVNIFSTWLLQACTLLFAVISVPLVTRRFGIEGLGLWLLVQQLASHIQLLELGLTSSLSRFLSRDLALHDSVAYGRHASTALVILIVMGALLTLLAIPMAQAFPLIFELPLHREQDAMWMLAIAILTTGFMLPLRSAIGVLTTQHRFALIAASDGVALLFRFILLLIVCVLLEQHALIALSLAVFVPGLVTSFALFVIAGRSIPQGLLGLRFLGIQPTRELLGVSLAAMVVTLAAVLLRQGSSMLAGFSLGVDVIPQLALPMMLVASLGPFLGIGNKIISPIASHLDATGRIVELRSTYLTATTYTLVVGLLIYACLLLLAPYFLPMWLGSEVIDQNYIHTIYINLLLVYGGFCLAVPALFARTVLIAVGQHRAAALGEFVSVIVGLVIGWILMDVFSFGATGMAVGIAAAYLIRAFGILMRQLASYFDMSPARLYADVWHYPIITVLPMCLAFVPMAFDNRELYIVLIFSLLALFLSATLFFRLIMPEGHQEKLRHLLRKAFSGRFGFKRK